MVQANREINRLSLFVGEIDFSGCGFKLVVLADAVQL